MIDLTGTITKVHPTFSPGTGDTELIQLLLVYADGRVICLSADEFRFDQFSAEPRLSVYEVQPSS